MSSAEPDRAQYPYAGWIPTVSGRLSFRHVGEARHPTPSVYANVATDKHRLVLAYQKRPLSDVKFTQITHKIFKLNGWFWFAIKAISDSAPGDENSFLGEIYLYKSKEDWRSKAEETVRKEIYGLHEDALSFDAGRFMAAEARIRTASTVLDYTTDITIKFVLYRNGDVYFSEPSILDPILRDESIKYANHWGQNFSEWAANQCYFFLRDIAHKHQHHPNSDDTVLILQRREKDELHWRKRVIYSMYYYIIGSKRAGITKTHIRALGMLAYCLSFQANCERHFKGKNVALPEFNNEALRQSIDARLREDSDTEDTESYSEAKRHAVSSTLRSYLLSIVAIIIALMAVLVQPHVAPDDPQFSQFRGVYDLSVFVTKHFLLALAVVGAVVIFIWACTSQAVLSLAYGRDALEVGLRRRYLVAAIATGVGICVLAYATYVWGIPGLTGLAAGPHQHVPPSP